MFQMYRQRNMIQQEKPKQAGAVRLEIPAECACAPIEPTRRDDVILFVSSFSLASVVIHINALIVHSKHCGFCSNFFISDNIPICISISA